MRGGRRSAKTLLVLAGLACCLTALAGCSQTLVGASTANPVTGTCHDLVYPAELQAASDANPTTACSRPHTVQTFTIGVVVGQYASWRKRPTPAVLESLTGTMCTAQSLREFLGAGNRDGVTGMSIHAYFPSESAWASGARQAGCDVAVNGKAGAPATTTGSLAGVMRRPESARLRICYRQRPAGDAWSTHGTTTTCNRPHTSQDLNAWLQLPSDDVTPAQASSRCTPYATQFAGKKALERREVRATGVVVHQSNGTWSLHCAIGGDSIHGDSTRALLPLHHE